MKREDFVLRNHPASRSTFHLKDGIIGFLSRLARWLDPHLALVWLLSWPAITPLIQPTITHSADGLLHLYRVVALDQAIQQGVLFPRWLPDLAYGYGLPLFIFYAPLSYYLTEGLNLVGFDMVGAFNASFGLALLASGAGVYLFVKDLFGPRAAILAGVAYVYAPYQLFNILSRGSLPIAWAGAIFPFAFWAFGRLIRQHNSSYLWLSALTCGAALLAHNISNLLFLPLLTLYLGVELLARSNRPIIQATSASSFPGSTSSLKRLLRAGLALGLGIGLATFFLMPAILEKEFAQVERVITPPDFDYHFNFVSLQELFSLPRPANTGLLNPETPLMLGLAQVGLAAIGLLSLVWSIVKGQSKKEELKRKISAFAAIGLVGAMFMMLPISVGVWDRLPLLAFIQQPHRLLSVTAFLLAVLSGMAVITLPERVGFSLTWSGCLLIFITVAPLLYPRYYAPLPAAPTLAGMLAYERTSGTIGTTSFGEYLPVWVRQIPRESPLEPMYQAETTIERLDPAYLPAGARIESARYTFNQAEVVIDSPQPYQAIFHTFYFPGWQARINGQPAPIAPVSERGLISIPIPAGQHLLQLRFQETPIRLAANVVSILALAIVISLAFKLRPSKLLDAPSAQLPILQVHKFSHPQLMSLAMLALALIFGKMFYLDRFDNPLKHNFDGVKVAGAEISRRVNFGHQVNLLGYDLKPQSILPGQSFALTAYWQARQPLSRDYSALAHLVDEQGNLYAGQDNLHPGHLPATRWTPWGFAQDPHLIRVAPGTPPGDYFLATGLYDPTTWVRLPVVAGGDPGWPDVVAIPVTILKPIQPPTLAELELTWPASTQTFQVLETWQVSGIQLLGATPEREVMRRNDFLRVALFWEATNMPLADYQVSLRLLAANDTVRAAETTRPSYGRYPTTRWTTGERVRDNHAFWIPANFPAGAYRLQVQLVAEAGQAVGAWVDLGVLEVEEQP